MFCKNCGKEIDDKADICIHCGVKVSKLSTETKDTPSNLAGVASCCFPVVGLILYFLWKDEKPKSSKLICKWTIAGFSISVICAIIYFVFIAAAVANSVSPY